MDTNIMNISDFVVKQFSLIRGVCSVYVAYENGNPFFYVFTADMEYDDHLIDWIFDIEYIIDSKYPHVDVGYRIIASELFGNDTEAIGVQAEIIYQRDV